MDTRQTDRSDVAKNCIFLQRFVSNALKQYNAQNLSGTIYISMALHPFVGLSQLFSFLILYIVGRTFGRVISLSQGLYLYTEQYKHRINVDTDIHALSGIRTHDASVRAGDDCSCLRLHDHCDRLAWYFLFMALQPFRPWLFQFFNPIHSRQDSLDAGSARLKVATYTQNNINTE
jgi:hypothetical protein